ncbi:MAG: FtsW/RodA/SpoVE family cell cycle protein [Lachnospiraceae bacterium]|nr:FtsW/RodA/SpoVE family cell cycle protein [Lachnospiraceae bacterium]
MGSFIAETSSYSMVAIFAAFLFVNIVVFFYKKPEKHTKTYFLQTLLVVMFHAIGYITLYVRSDDVRYFLFFAFQEIMLFALAMIYRTIYRHMSHLLLNNMLMLLFIGFVILGRLAFENAIRQFIITLVAFAISIMIPWFILKFGKLKKLTYFYAGIGIFLLGAVWLTGAVTNGSRLAFKLFGMSFQPSEFIKISLVFFNAAILSDRKNKYRYWISALFTAVHVMLLVLSRDLGSACIYLGTYVFMLFLANKNVLTLLCSMVSGAGAAVLAYKLFSHVRIRVQTWLDPWGDMDNKSYQLSQSLFAIGTGGYFGMGIMRGNPFSIPVVHEDFVFSAIAEELGVIFSILLIFIYLFIVLHVLRMSFRVKDEFHGLILAGLAITLGIQVFLTIGGGSRLVPLTGVTLPLISMGGSSLTATILMFSVLHGIYIKEFTDYDEEELLEALEEAEEDYDDENAFETNELTVSAVQSSDFVDSENIYIETKVISRKKNKTVSNEGLKDEFTGASQKENTFISDVKKTEEVIEIKTEQKNNIKKFSEEELDWEKDEYQGNARKDW